MRQQLVFVAFMYSNILFKKVSAQRACGVLGEGYERWIKVGDQ